MRASRRNDLRDPGQIFRNVRSANRGALMSARWRRLCRKPSLQCSEGVDAALRRVVTLAALLAGLMTAQAADETLTLACQGTVIAWTQKDAENEPISVGMIVNFTNGTVQGFGDPGSVDVRITAVNDVAILFRGNKPDGAGFLNISGAMDRVSGLVQARVESTDETGVKVLDARRYDLKCRPTRRMF